MNTTTYKWSHGQAIRFQKFARYPPVNTANRQDCTYIPTSKLYYDIVIPYMYIFKTSQI